jgi:hypothetical protein
VLTRGIDGQRLLLRRLRLRGLGVQGVLFGFQLLEMQLQRNLREVCNALRNFLVINNNGMSGSACFGRGQQSIVQGTHGALHLRERISENEESLK